MKPFNPQSGVPMLCSMALVIGLGVVSIASADEELPAPPAQDAAADKAKANKAEAEEQEVPLYLSDSVAFRKHEVMQILCDQFGIKPEPEEGDKEIDLLPKNTRAIEVRNPGFEFTYNNGTKPGRDYWIIGVQEGQQGYIQGGMSGRSDAIEGWSAVGCSGLESGRPKQWKTTPDGCTGYILAQGRDNTLYQVLTGELKPKTRYTLVVEVYKRNDYKRAEQRDLIVKLTDSNGNDLKTSQADYFITPADPETGFAVSLISLTTSADQPNGDLKINLGMNTKGGIRANFDNVRLWAQPIE